MKDEKFEDILDSIRIDIAKNSMKSDIPLHAFVLVSLDRVMHTVKEAFETFLDPPQPFREWYALFDVDTYDDGACYLGWWVSTKSFYNENDYIDDSCLDKEDIPKGWSEGMEHYIQCDRRLTAHEQKAELEELGYEILNFPPCF